MSDAVIEVTEQTFGVEVLQSALPVVVDFWAPWCPPCRMAAPVVEKAAEEFAGRAKFVKVDVEENLMLARQYGILAIPCFKAFRDGTEVSERLGLQPWLDFKAWIEREALR